jgi:hypothetical protein
MNRWHAVVIGCLAIALVWTGVAAQQEVLSRPGPGTGLSSVNVVNRPSVAAEQSGEWQVAIRGISDVRITNATPVRVQLPQFAGKGKFLVTWPNGQTENIQVLDVGEDGWVQVANAARTGPRWMNLRIAREIEELK